MGFLGSSNGKESACNEGDLGSIPGLGRSPGEGNGNPLQYSCLEDPTDRGAWRAQQAPSVRTLGRVGNNPKAIWLLGEKRLDGPGTHTSDLYEFHSSALGALHLGGCAISFPKGWVLRVSELPRPRAPCTPCLSSSEQSRLCPWCGAWMNDLSHSRSMGDPGARRGQLGTCGAVVRAAVGKQLHWKELENQRRERHKQS